MLKHIKYSLLSLGMGLSVAANAADGSLLEKPWAEIEAQAKQEQSINFYTWYFLEGWNKVAEAFEDKYGVKVNVINGESDVVVRKLIAERNIKEGHVDVFAVGGSSAKTALDANLLYGPVLPVLPSEGELDQDLATAQEGLLTHGYLTPFNRNQTGFAYDPLRLNEDELPQTWSELENFINKYPRDFGFNDPNYGGSGQAFVHTVISELAGGLEKYTGDEEIANDKVENWDNVWRFLNEYKGKYTLTSSNADSYTRLNDGELTLIAAWEDDLVNAMANGSMNKRMKLYIPEMGMAGGGDTVGIAHNSSKKAASLLWVNYLASQEGQQILADNSGNFPANTLATQTESLIPTEQLKYGVKWFPAPYKKLMADDFTRKVIAN